MNSITSIRLLLALVSSAMILPFLIQPVSSHRVLHHTGNRESVRASHDHRRNHSQEEIVHNNHHAHNRHQTHRPAGHLEVLDHQPLEFWPICSWCHSVHFDVDRVPKVLPIASCCGVAPRLNITGVRGPLNAPLHCETIYYSLLVKLRITNQTEDSEDSWQDKWLKVPAGCTPAHPVTQRHSSNEEYVRPGPTLS